MVLKKRNQFLESKINNLKDVFIKMLFADLRECELLTIEEKDKMCSKFISFATGIGFIYSDYEKFFVQVISKDFLADLIRFTVNNNIPDIYDTNGVCIDFRVFVR